MKIWEVMQQDNVGKKYRVGIEEFDVLFMVKWVGTARGRYLDTEIFGSILDGGEVHYQKYTSIEDTFILEDILNAEYEEVL